jgi:hypothetical protein
MYKLLILNNLYDLRCLQSDPNSSLAAFPCEQGNLQGMPVFLSRVEPSISSVIPVIESYLQTLCVDI